MNQAAIVTLLIESAAVIVVAPLAGAAMQSSRQLILTIAALIVAGAAVTAVTGNGAWQLAALSQFILISAAAALAAIGRLCGTAFADRLDAAACSLAVTFVLTIGVLVARPIAADMPTALLNATLRVNPLVATTAAANIDLFRSDPLYRLSPIAHRQFEYPTWSSSSLLFIGAAVAGFVINRRRAPDSA